VRYRFVTIFSALLAAAGKKSVELDPGEEKMANRRDSPY